VRCLGRRPDTKANNQKLRDLCEVGHGSCLLWKSLEHEMVGRPEGDGIAALIADADQADGKF